MAAERYGGRPHGYGCHPWVDTVNPKLIQGNGAVSQSFMSPASTAGVWG